MPYLVDHGESPPVAHPVPEVARPVPAHPVPERAWLPAATAKERMAVRVWHAAPRTPMPLQVHIRAVPVHQRGAFLGGRAVPALIMLDLADPDGPQPQVGSAIGEHRVHHRHDVVDARLGKPAVELADALVVDGQHVDSGASRYRCRIVRRRARGPLVGVADPVPVRIREHVHEVDAVRLAAGHGPHRQHFVEPQSVGIAGEATGQTVGRLASPFPQGDADGCAGRRTVEGDRALAPGHEVAGTYPADDRVVPADIGLFRVLAAEEATVEIEGGQHHFAALRRAKAAHRVREYEPAAAVGRPARAAGTLEDQVAHIGRPRAGCCRHEQGGGEADRGTPIPHVRPAHPFVQSAPSGTGATPTRQPRPEAPSRDPKTARVGWMYGPLVRFDRVLLERHRVRRRSRRSSLLHESSGLPTTKAQPYSAADETRRA